MASKKPKSEPLFPTDYWNRPEKRNDGDVDHVAIFQAVGQALNAWEQLEEKIAMLATIFFDSRDAKATISFQRSFGVVESSSTRRTILLELADVFFWPLTERGKDLKERLAYLSKQMSEASRRRDDFAHGKVMTRTFYNDFRPGAPAVTGSFLYPSNYNTVRNAAFLDLETLSKTTFAPERAKFRYTSSDINLIQEKFRRLDSEVMNYFAEVVKFSGEREAPTRSNSDFA